MTKWTSDDGRVTLYCGDALEVLPLIPASSIDSVVTDPPYAEISRDYGRLTEPQWHALMNPVVEESRRVLTPTGSAVYILQPNSEKVGRMRPWLWEFMAKWTREWGMVQDAWWWNSCALPTGGATMGGLMRGSIKPCLWFGDPLCYRNQLAVLWTESQANAARRATERAGRIIQPSGASIDMKKCRDAAVRRGGTVPFNLLPFAAANGTNGGGLSGHSAATPQPLADWWLRYICPPGGTVLDPFIGSGTVGLSAIAQGKRVVGIEREAKYFEIAKARIIAELDKSPLFKGEAS
jgi:DNA modification methylase